MTGNNRPLIHFTPESGWLNDPNGLFFDRKEKLWHLYFQYNPNEAVWDLPLYWGHATSNDLVNWKHHDVALSPEKDNEGIFSGSIVIDDKNTSGFFDDSIHPDQRVVAIYTNHDCNNMETQEIAYSLDAGYTFTKYEANPVLDHNSSQFRDPKVFWHEPSNQWVMVVVKSQEFKIQIYGSTNLKDWKFHSNFSSGIYGFQYECPGLFEVPIENSSNSKWVMILAINPGSPIGGSFNQYFVGDFDGFNFVADDTQSRIMDIGKDFYAFQNFSGVEEGAIGLAWASNWQYANLVPTTEWRSSMSLARRYTLKEININPETKILSLIQRPIIPDSITAVNSIEETSFEPTINNSLSLVAQDSTGMFDFKLRFKVKEKGFSNKEKITFDILVQSQVQDNELDTVKIGFDAGISSYYFNRAIEHKSFDNEFFTDKLSTYIEPLSYDEHNLPIFELYGIVDRNIIELYFNDGAVAMTNTFFMNEGRYPHLLKLATNTEDSKFEFEEVSLRHLTN